MQRSDDRLLLRAEDAAPVLLRLLRISYFPSKLLTASRRSHSNHPRFIDPEHPLLWTSLPAVRRAAAAKSLPASKCELKPAGVVGQRGGMECAPCAARPPSGMCEDCSQKTPRFGVPGEVPKNRWCAGCAQKHTGAVSMRKQATCEDCTKQPRFGVPGDLRRRARPPRLRLRTLRPSHSVQPSTRRPQAIASRVEGRCEHQLGREQHRRGRCQLHCRPVASKRDSSKPNRKRTAFEHDAAQKAVVPNFWVVHPAAGRGDTWPTAVNGHPYLSAKGGCERLHLATAAGPGGAVGTPAVAGSDGAEQ